MMMPEKGFKKLGLGLESSEVQRTENISTKIKKQLMKSQNLLLDLRHPTSASTKQMNKLSSSIGFQRMEV